MCRHMTRPWCMFVPQPGLLLRRRWSPSTSGSGLGRCLLTTVRGDGVAGDGIGARGALITITATGTVGEIPIVRRITGIIRDRSCGPIVRDIVVIGAIVHPTIGRLTIGQSAIQRRGQD